MFAVLLNVFYGKARSLVVLIMEIEAAIVNDFEILPVTESSVFPALEARLHKLISSFGKFTTLKACSKAST